MPRVPRIDLAGFPYHVLNRANARVSLFVTHGEYEQFEMVLHEAVHRTRMRLLAYCVMPNHFHLIIQPHQDGDVGRFMAWLTLTHTQRLHARRGSAGSGHLYQGRYKSFVIQNDNYLETACRYVERNALRAGLVKRAEDWEWSSLHRYSHRSMAMSRCVCVHDQASPCESYSAPIPLASWPIHRPDDWIERVNIPQTPAELAAIHASTKHSRPLGTESFAYDMAARYQSMRSMTPRGRPRGRTENVRNLNRAS